MINQTFLPFGFELEYLTDEMTCKLPIFIQNYMNIIHHIIVANYYLVNEIHCSIYLI